MYSVTLDGNMRKQAGFAEPHSSSTIGWVVVGLGLWSCWGRSGVGLGLGLRLGLG